MTAVRSTLFLLSCFMTLAIVTCKNMFPTYVDHIDKQCMRRGHLAACDNINWSNGIMNCRNIACAGPLLGPDSFFHRAIFVGSAADGSRCSQRRNKLCYHGQCINLPQGSAMPIELGESDVGFDCTDISRASSGRSG